MCSFTLIETSVFQHCHPISHPRSHSFIHHRKRHIAPQFFDFVSFLFLVISFRFLSSTPSPTHASHHSTSRRRRWRNHTGSSNAVHWCCSQSHWRSSRRRLLLHWWRRHAPSASTHGAGFAGRWRSLDGQTDNVFPSH